MTKFLVVKFSKGKALAQGLSYSFFAILVATVAAAPASADND